MFTLELIKPLNSELNPNCHLLALLGAHHILDVGRMRVKPFTFLEGEKNIRIAGIPVEIRIREQF